jgi:uridylate kinase
MDNHMPLVVFYVFEADNLRRIVQGEPIGTLVTD